ncbi:DNA helicase/exodeoxyribonuclease V, subunit A [Rhodovulum sp. ES.010]|uniref:double-strand break repair helicase AddA n=1 Tax=Rhodovulum sp. ES.010 TaxID=1882821 RepID=UPI000927C304|nr:double-strand break repair helicase AddA [Rhodovulum sp. ES.010]SIO49553.1 DNA helicase/exodeoxyribonuclease V, subunit A [Rhodovulum sp. ES.010]
MRRDPATERQVQAADPANSTWLSANAGSGKTRVLTDRVARLLLNRVPPERILCLTYTKAAASEMQNRLFRRLGDWAMLGDADLRNALRRLGQDGPIEAPMLREARRLFARAIETPGGLKIQTIHSFCAALLRRFPLEAGVSPQFVEMDDRAARRLRAEIVEEMADGADAAAFAALARFHVGDDLDGLTAEIGQHRHGFPVRPDAEAIWRQFGLAPGTDAACVLRGVVTGDEPELMARVLPVLQAGTKTDAKAAALLGGLDFGRPSLGLLEALEGPFLYGAKTSAAEPFSAKVGAFPTKATRAALGPALARLDALMERVAEGRRQRLALAAAERTLALHRFAAAFLPRYDRRKLERGWLDFDDLILKARALLTDPGVAQWVLFRLDGGLDHILVDEAQDTSPAQWDVIERLAEEFTAGAGARADVERTIFVVGDKKQSIYSFQGADPDGFDRMKDLFRTRLQGIDRALVELPLEYSFRSSPAILGVVDQTFPEGARQGLGREMLHRAFHDDLPGRVELWPVVEPAGPGEEGHWADPVDTPSERHHSVTLARRVAGAIRAMIDDGATIAKKVEGGGLRRRPVHEGDVLILVQRRSDLFHEIIRACKAQGLEVAGADRLKIGGELAVRDLTALLSFLALPEDDLSLACALRSPLFGWDEAALYRLAAKRSGAHLWQVLRHADWAGTETKAALDDLARHADFLRPYEVLERILTRHDGRRRLIARLGEEAEDGIDALLAQALSYERLEVPSLTGFLAWIESDEVEIKRQLDSAGDRLRVMTVHGAKGLEAPIVILPDTAQRDVRIRDQLLPLPAGGMAWTAPADARPDLLAAAHEARVRREEEERQRLLYVAMTRAEQWLIVAAAGNLAKDGSDWYSRVARGLESLGDAYAFGFGTGLRYETGDWSGAAETPPAPPAPVATALPDWARREAPARDRESPPLTPSDLGGAKALPGEGEQTDAEAAKARGTWMHLLLEHLPGTPVPKREALAHTLLSACDPPAPANAIAALLAEAQELIAHPSLAEVFAPGTLAEVPFAAEIMGRPVRGAIDRLIVTPERVCAVDFKTNRLVPSDPGDVPEGLLRQVGAYAAALAQIFPGRRVETAILWTRTADLMPIPESLGRAALGRLPAP